MFSDHFEFCNIYLTQQMQNDWTMNKKQNVMSHTRITHDKFHNKKYKMAASRPFFFFFFFLITRATNKKILVSAFLGKSFQQILFGKYTQQSQPMTWLTFGANNFKLVFER